MKKLFSLFTIAILAIVSCKKEGSDCDFVETNKVATSTEIAHIQDYLSTNGIVASQHPSGIFYTINSQGTGAKPGICSTVFLKYTGKIMETGGIFDQNLDGFSIIVGQFIVGAQKGIQLLNKGGRIDLYIPPSLGYGDQVIRNQSGQVVIPAQSYLKFEFELVDVQ